LQPTYLPGHIHRVKNCLRSLVCATVTLCFALSAFTWGSMPGCAVPASTPAAHTAQGHGTHHDHSGKVGSLPGSDQCTVHLCCLQLTGPTRDASTPVRLSTPEQGSGLVAATFFVPLRPSHSLPFAHAPPGTPA
jgi:hypothetical protein